MKIDFEKVLAEYNLKTGDKVVVRYGKSDVEFTIRSADGLCYLADEHDRNFSIDHLSNEWHKVEPKAEEEEPKKKLGDCTCIELDGCHKCPLYCINCDCVEWYSDENTIEEEWEDAISKFPQLEPMRESIEKKLNEEVK